MMRIGCLARGEPEELRRLAELGLRSMEWVCFTESPAGPDSHDWKPHAEELAAVARESDVRISCIAALYRNPLDPDQSDAARTVFRRAVQVASHMGISTVAGFPGALLDVRLNERGGNLVYYPWETSVPALVRFWEPLAEYAADHGVRIAFEHCPQGPFHLPVMGYNAFGQPAVWERFFNDIKTENVGLEWDPSHLICQLIDPLENLSRFASKIFHVHAKDGWINWPLLRVYGLCHPGVAEHRFPGLGETDWGQVIHGLLRAGYDSDLNIEGWHDPVYRDHEEGPLAGQHLETAGVLIAKRILAAFLPEHPLQS